MIAATFERGGASEGWAGKGTLAFGRKRAGGRGNTKKYGNTRWFPTKKRRARFAVGKSRPWGSSKRHHTASRCFCRESRSYACHMKRKGYSFLALLTYACTGHPARWAAPLSVRSRTAERVVVGEKCILRTSLRRTVCFAHLGLEIFDVVSPLTFRHVHWAVMLYERAYVPPQRLAGECLCEY